MSVSGYSQSSTYAAVRLLQVTEEQLANLFQACGRVVDCRVCGDPNSAMKFAFIEFLEQTAVKTVRLNANIIVNLPILPALAGNPIVMLLPAGTDQKRYCARHVPLESTAIKNSHCTCQHSVPSPHN